MKTYLFYADAAFLILLTAGAVLFTGNIWIAGAGAFILANTLFLFFLQRSAYEKELDRISGDLEAFLSGKTILPKQETEELLPSKIRHQMLRLQAMIRTCREKAEKDNREIRNLIVEIAHQLRMPLANLETYLDLLYCGDLTDEEIGKYLDAAGASKEQLSFLIESFIKMARLETKVIQLKKQSRDLEKTILKAILQEEREAREKDIEITFCAKQKAQVLHDENWLGEAVENLIDNSIKYSPPGSQIHISLEENQMFAEIRIRDYGIGIEPEEEAEIFKRFYRGKRVTSEKGFGLGMYLAREIVSRHQGFLKVRRQQQGLSCSIFLPNSQYKE